MKVAATAGKIIGVTAAVLIVLYLMSGWIFRPFGPPVDLRAIVVWLLYAAGVVAVSRSLAPTVVVGAASLLTVVAGVNLVGVALPVSDTIVPSYISASEYTWIAIGVLYANAFGRTRADTHPSQPNQQHPAEIS